MFSYIATKISHLTIAHLTIIILNILSPLSSHVQKNVAYGAESTDRADIYQQTDGTAHPVVVFLYGGGWRGGSKESVAYIGAALTSKGFVVVIPEYRHYPAVSLSDILADNATAVAWTIKHAQEFGGDAKKIFVFGYSSGAWAATMLALDPKWLAQADSERTALAGVIGISGPYTISSLAEQADKDIFAGAGPEMEPLNDCSTDQPPMLLLTGADDTDVSPFSTIALADRARKFGNQVEVHTYPGFGHDGVIRAVSRPFSLFASVSNDIEHFVKHHEIK